MEKNNVFKGPNAVRTFMNPDENPMIPLVELPSDLNPFLGEKVRIFAKLMYLLPLLNVKSVMAFNMLLDAEREGGLERTETIVENSSGNTGISLAILGKMFGIANVVTFVPGNIAEGKLKLLRMAGAEVRKVGPGEKDGTLQAREAGKSEGFLNLDQYENQANVEAHYRWTGKQIWKQTEGRISLFCAGLGTTGMILGVKKYLKEMRSGAPVLGVVVEPGGDVPGVRTAERLKMISFDWKSEVDFTVEAGTGESYRKSLSLIRSGFMAGPSSGFALVGLLKFLEGRKRAGDLDNFRNEEGEIVAVFACADTPFPYLDKYAPHLD